MLGQFVQHYYHLNMYWSAFLKTYYYADTIKLYLCYYLNTATPVEAIVTNIISNIITANLSHKSGLLNILSVICKYQ